MSFASEYEVLHGGPRPPGVVLSYVRYPDHPHKEFRGRRYSVTYGDDGWEREAGTYMETRDTAINEVREHIMELQAILEILKREPE